MTVLVLTTEVRDSPCQVLSAVLEPTRQPEQLKSLELSIAAQALFGFVMF